MAKNKDSPEHCPLSSPVERPHSPRIEEERSSGKSKYDDNVSENIAKRPPRILDPTMLRNGSSDLRNLKRRWITRVKITSSVNSIEVMMVVHCLKTKNAQAVKWFRAESEAILMVRRAVGRGMRRRNGQTRDVHVATIPALGANEFLAVLPESFISFG